MHEPARDRRRRHGDLAVWLTTRQHDLVLAHRHRQREPVHRRLLRGASSTAPWDCRSPTSCWPLYGWYSWLRGGPGHGRAAGVSDAAACLAPARRRGPRRRAAARRLAGLPDRRGAAVDRRHDDRRSASSHSSCRRGSGSRTGWSGSWWIVVYVAMYLSQGLGLTAVLYAIYLGLARARVEAMGRHPSSRPLRHRRNRVRVHREVHGRAWAGRAPRRAVLRRSSSASIST